MRAVEEELQTTGLQRDFLKNVYCLCMSVFPLCMSVRHVHVRTWYPWRPAEGVGSSGTGVIDSCKVPCGCQELITVESNLQPFFLCNFTCHLKTMLRNAFTQIFIAILL